MKKKEISYKNKKDVNNLYLHDMYFNNINIDITNKRIIMDVRKNVTENYQLIFENIIRLEMSRLDLWGHSKSEILEIYLENFDLYKYINQKEEQDNYKRQEKFFTAVKTKYNNPEQMFSIGILTNSGDEINISCEKLIFINFEKEH